MGQCMMECTNCSREITLNNFLKLYTLKLNDYDTDSLDSAVNLSFPWHVSGRLFSFSKIALLFFSFFPNFLQGWQMVCLVRVMTTSRKCLGQVSQWTNLVFMCLTNIIAFLQMNHNCVFELLLITAFVSYNSICPSVCKVLSVC